MLAAAAPNADLATTTSSLPVGALGEAAGASERFYGLHVFNPVARMELVELCLPDGLAPEVARARAGLVCCDRQDGGRGPRPDRVRRQPAAVPVPVRGGAADGVDRDARERCRRLHDARCGAPDGPAALLDFVGLDVAAAIGDSLDRHGAGSGADHVPELISEMIAAGKLGRKSGAGFYEY